MLKLWTASVALLATVNAATISRSSMPAPSGDNQAPSGWSDWSSYNTAEPTRYHPPLATGAHPSMPAYNGNQPPPEGNCYKVQYDFPAGTNSNKDKANAVAAGYRRSWERYAAACLNGGVLVDDLLPLNNSCENDLMAWGASVVDGIDTAIIMNLTDIVQTQLTFISKVDFSTSIQVNVSGFDAVIRYLAGLLSAHDILTSGYVPDGTYDQKLIDDLLSQATVLGDKLKYQFDTESGLPASQTNFNTDQIVQSTYTSPLNNETYNATNCAVAGTLILEFHRLADKTGDETFRQLADRSESYLINPNPAPYYPGLVGSNLDTDTGNFLTFDYGWKAGIDSFFEYLIKDYYYDPAPAQAQAEKDFWVTAVDSTIQHIALHPYQHPELTYITQADVFGEPQYEMDDYACFSGGNFLLGSKILGRSDYYDLGLRVTDSCHHLYNTTATGLGMLTWAWYNDTDMAYDPDWDTNTTYRDEFDKNGYFILAPEYGSFPETIESIFYAYRITGDTRWQDYNWEIFNSLNKLMEFEATYITDVNKPGSYFNFLPSFHFAEVSKYLYLSFVDPEIISLEKFVFNTEAHPFMRIGADKCGNGGTGGNGGNGGNGGWNQWKQASASTGQCVPSKQ